MTNAQKLALKLSEIAGRLNEIGVLEADAYSEEVRAEETKLQTENRETRTRYESALLAEGADAQHAGEQFAGDTSEDRAYRKLVSDADLAEIVSASIENRATEGPEAEIQAHHHLTARQVPLSMLRGEEHRAVSTAPTNTGTAEQPVIQPVFAGGDAAYLGASMPTVDAGDAVFPVLKTRPTVGGPHTDSTEVAETVGAWDAELLTPARYQSEFFWKRTDAARFRGMGDSLRQALNSGLSEAVDAQVVSGTNGLLTGTVLANNTVSAQTTWQHYIEQLVTGRVDGRYAANPKAIKLLLGSGTYTHGSSQYRTTESDQSAVDRLMELAADVRVSAHVPAVSSSKQNVLVRLGMRPDMVVATWEGITLIPDEISKAKSGEIVLTAVMLAAVKVLRADGFYKQQTKHS